MLICTRDNGYESAKFAELGAKLDTDNLFYKFSKDGNVNIYLTNKTDTALFLDKVSELELVKIVLRYSNNSDSFFAKVMSELIKNNIVFDRPVESYSTKGIPKINSELKKHFTHGNRITWYVAFSRDTLIANADVIEYPCVYKPANGNHGKGIIKVDNQMELFNLEHDWSKPMFLQEFYNKFWEYRVITWNGEVVNFARKKLKGENGNQFGGRKFVPTKNPLLTKYVDYIRQYAKKGLLGIDIVSIDDGRVIIVEENRTPEWESLDNATGKNTAALVEKAMENEN